MNNEKGSLFIFLLCYEELFSILLSLWEQLHCLKTWTRYVVKRYLCLVAILSRRHAYVLFKELSQETLVREMKQVGDVFNAFCGGFE